MKKGKWIFGMVLFTLLIAAAISSCDNNDDDLVIDDSCDLTIEQQDGLLYMREEEKLARDVYNYLAFKWDVNIFKNIAKAEQNHMDMLLQEVDLCNFEDSVLPEDGKFNNSHIQDLYDALTAQGDISLIEAYKVGATIEDVDIFDLDEFSSKTDNETLLDIYDKLTCGSRNHLRAFMEQLNNVGGSYAPQFISQEHYDDILAGEHERCGN